MGTNNGQFNVKDYGAVGDCVTDDTAAIQAAIDAAKAVTKTACGFGISGGTVFFPPGWYRCGSTIYINNADSIKLTSNNVAPYVTGIIYSADTGSLFSLSRAANIAFEDLVLWATNSSYNGILVQLGTASDTQHVAEEIFFHRVNFSGADATSTCTLLKLRYAWDVRIVKCGFQQANLGIYGVDPGTVTSGNDVAINRVWIENCDFAVINQYSILNHGFDWRVMGCGFGIANDKSCSGIGNSLPPEVICWSLLIQGCIFPYTTSGTRSQLTLRTRNALISQNRFGSPGTAPTENITLLSGCTGITFTGNDIISRTTSPSIKIPAGGYTDGLNLLGNYFEAGSVPSILVLGTLAGYRAVGNQGLDGAGINTSYLGNAIVNTQGGVAQSVTTHGAVTVDPTLGETYVLTANGNVTGITIRAGIAGQKMSLVLIQNLGGKATWPTTFVNATIAGGTFSKSLRANAVDTIEFKYDSVNSKWRETTRSLHQS